MPYFEKIDPANTRRFRTADGDIVAIYDQCRSWTKYAFVGADVHGNATFAGEPRCYFSDQIEEIRP
jgi:hypothetical protein